MHYIAFATKGLEQIAIAELRQRIHDLEILEVGDKRVLFASKQPFTTLLELRSIDDLCLFVAKVEPLQALDDLLPAVRTADFESIRSIIQEHRALNNDFSITTTMVGAEHITAPQLSDAVQNEIRKRYSWVYSERDHSQFDLRLFIDRRTGYIAVRLAAQSLMHREYKKQTKPGSLRPTVAAAMVYLATGFRNGFAVVDNFCGSGTILCEAAALGNTISGGDIDPESVSNTLSNLKYIAGSSTPQVRVLDAVKTRWPDRTFDCAISNLPWGKQISLQSIATLFEGTLKEYSRIVKERGVVCVLTPRPEPLVKYAKKHIKGSRITQVPISFTGQSPVIILIERD